MTLDVEVIGNEPPLVGSVCQALLCEGFEFKGKFESPSNVVYVRVTNNWHRLVIDAGVVFWRAQNEEPKPWAVPEKGYAYPHRNLGEEFHLVGELISSVHVSRHIDVVEVTLHFLNGKRFTLVNSNDISTFTVTQD